MFDKSSKESFFNSLHNFYTNKILENSIPNRTETYLFYYDDDKNDPSCHWYFQVNNEEELFYLIIFKYCYGYICEMAMDWTESELMNIIETVKTKLLDTKFYYLYQTELPHIIKFNFYNL